MAINYVATCDEIKTTLQNSETVLLSIKYKLWKRNTISADNKTWSHKTETIELHVQTSTNCN